MNEGRIASIQPQNPGIVHKCLRSRGLRRQFGPVWKSVWHCPTPLAAAEFENRPVFRPACDGILVGLRGLVPGFALRGREPPARFLCSLLPPFHVDQPDFTMLVRHAGSPCAVLFQTGSDPARIECY